MSDSFTTLPTDLFLSVIFPQLPICNLIYVKNVSKQFKRLVEEYQKLYKGYVDAKYRDALKVNTSIPNSHLCLMLSTSDLMGGYIESYPVVKTLFISHYILRRNFPLIPRLKFNPDLSKFTQLIDLTLLCALAPSGLSCDNLSNLSMLTNLEHLCIVNSRNTSDLSALSNLKRFKMINCPNITKLPTHLKLRQYHELGESITATEQYSVMEDVD